MRCPNCTQLLTYASVGWMLAMLLNFTWHVWIPIVGLVLGLVGVAAGLMADSHLAM